MNQQRKKLKIEIARVTNAIRNLEKQLDRLNRQGDMVYVDYEQADERLRNIPAVSVLERQAREVYKNLQLRVDAARRVLAELLENLARLENGRQTRKFIELTAVENTVDPRVRMFFRGIAGRRTLAVLKDFVESYPLIPVAYQQYIRNTVLRQQETTGTVILALVRYFLPDAKQALMRRGITFGLDSFFDNQIAQFMRQVKTMCASIYRHDLQLAKTRQLLRESEQTAVGIGQRRKHILAELTRLRGICSQLTEQYENLAGQQMANQRKAREVALRRQKLLARNTERLVKANRARVSRFRADAAKSQTRQRQEYARRLKAMREQIISTPTLPLGAAADIYRPW